MVSVHNISNTCVNHIQVGAENNGHRVFGPDFRVGRGFFSNFPTSYEPVVADIFPEKAVFISKHHVEIDLLQVK